MSGCVFTGCLKMELVFEPVSPDDVEGMDKWLSQFDLAEFMTGWVPRTVRAGNWRPELCRWDVIVIEGRRVGAVWIERERVGDRTADLGILIAEPEFRRIGIGTQVLRTIHEWSCQCWGTETIRLRVRATNLPAVACYKKNGYRIMRASTRCMTDSSYDVLHMERDLRDPATSKSEQDTEADRRHR